MTNPTMSRTAVIRAFFALIVVAAIAWQLPFSVTAEGEGDPAVLGAAAPLVATTTEEVSKAAGCFPRADIDEGNIQIQNGVAKAFVENKTAGGCTYDVTLTSYKVFKPQGDPDFLSTQKLFDSKTVALAPGEGVWIEVTLPPQCAYQVDLYLGGEESNPENITAEELLKFKLNQDLPLCGPVGPPPPPECPADFIQPVLTSPVELTGLKNGDAIEYEITFSGQGNISVKDVRGLPWWLKWDGGTKVTGTIPSTTVTDKVSFTVDLISIKNNGLQCGESSTKVSLFWSAGPDTPPTDCPVIPGDEASKAKVRQDLQILSSGVGTQGGFEISGGKSTIRVKNNGDCIYHLGQSSFKVFIPRGEDGHFATQELFDFKFITLAPGETKSITINVPQCQYQVDFYARKSAEHVNPRHGNMLLDGYLADELPLCKAAECPAKPTITSTPPSANNVPVGTPYSYTVTTSGGVAPVAVTITPINAAPGLIISGKTLSGTLLVPGTYSYTVKALSANSPSECAVPQTITISVAPPPPPVCPVPPVITSTIPANTNLTVGQSFSYTATAQGGTPPLQISLVPAGLAAPGLTISGTTLSGTVTTPGKYDYVVTAFGADPDPTCVDRQVFSITVLPVAECPAKPTITSTPPSANNVAVGTSYSYTVTTSGGVAPVAVTITPINAAPGLTISGTTLSGTLTTPGTYSYSVSALSANSPASCAVPQTITISVAPSVACPAKPTFASTPPTVNNVPTGTSYSYTASTTGGVAPVAITITAVNAAPGLTINGATLSGTLTTAGSFSYVASALSANSPAECAVTQTITMSATTGGDDDDDDDDDDGGGGGGGGSRRRPSVVLFSEPEVAGASVSLAQVPYTGLGTNLLQIFLFIVGLLAISAGVVYGITRRLRRNAESAIPQTARIGGMHSVAVAENVDTMALSADLDPYEEYIHAAPRQRTPDREIAPTPQTAPTAMGHAPAALEHVIHPVAQERPASAASSLSPHGTGEAVRASSSNNSEMALEAKSVDPTRLQNEARASHTLVSDDGAALIAHSAEGDEKRALERLSQVIDIAKTRYPREDGWLILDKDRVRESLFISTLSMIPLFIEWVVRAEDKKVFTFLRMLKHQEQPVADFMRKVVAELDTAHRARLEGSEERAQTNAHIAEVTYHLSNKELEAIVAELLHGVDERYDSAYTSVRLSLVRVLDMIKERSLRAVGTPYAFSNDRETA